MTREEKIEILEKEKAYMLAHGGDRQAEALTSAIIALEQETCEDCISRKEAISVMCSNCPDWQTCKLNCCIRKALENKKKLPSVYPEKIKCEDAISRQAVLDLIADYDLSMGEVVRGIHALQSVNPQLKTGNSIIEKDRHFLDTRTNVNVEMKEATEKGYHTYINVQCSKCRRVIYQYCPHCGERIVEPQERSGEE